MNSENLIIPQDMTVNLHFKDRSCVITMQLKLKKGQHAEKYLESLSKQQRIPLHLIPNALSCLNTIFEEERELMRKQQIRGLWLTDVKFTLRIYEKAN